MLRVVLVSTWIRYVVVAAFVVAAKSRQVLGHSQNGVLRQRQVPLLSLVI